MKFEFDRTGRGFAVLNFRDDYGESCSLQKSSRAGQDCIWLGIDDANPLIMASHAGVINPETGEMSGWVKYDIPDNVLLTTRMHLTRKQARELAKALNRFARTGQVKP